MNCCVPEFFVEDDPVFASSIRSFVDSSPFGEEIVELLWDNGPVFRRTSQDEIRSRSGISASCTAAEPSLEDEMVAWLNYPLGDGEDRSAVVSDQAIPAAEPLDCSRRNPSAAAEGLKTPAAQQRFFRSVESGESTIDDSILRSKPAMEALPEHRANSGFEKGESTIDDSILRSKPAMEALPEHRANSGFEKGETIAGDQGITASSGVICETEASDPKAPPIDSRKQKVADTDDSDSISESIDKQDDSRRSASKKRPRAAEVHNLSERRRRDRINEKMKALQDLLPRCNKSDKASMLDDAIRYLKFLQSQVQMMSMYCNMYPMMVPGVHHHHQHANQFLPQMGMAMPMGMNMGLGMRPIPPPFFPVLSSPRMGPPSAAHLSQGPHPMADLTLARSSQQQNPGFSHENAKQLAGSRGQRPGSIL